MSNPAARHQKIAMARTRQKCNIQRKGGSAEAVPASELDAIQLLGDPQGCKLLAILAAGRPGRESPRTILLIRLDCARSTSSTSVAIAIDLLGTARVRLSSCRHHCSEHPTIQS